MKKYITALLTAATLLLGASASHAANFYITTTGNNGNSGTFASPWATPNHNVACTDTIWVVPGTYTGVGWNTGTASGATQTCMAKLYCGGAGGGTTRANLNSCMLSGTGFDIIEINQSGWDIRGFNVTYGAATSHQCIYITPRANAHIAYINIQDNVVYTCNQGISSSVGNASGGTYFGVDYLSIQNNIVYNSAIASAGSCTSGISIFQPFAIDSLPGPHYVISGNFSYANINSWTDGGGNYCGTSIGGPRTLDGEGIILDTYTWDTGYGRDGYGYPAVTLVENNILIGNGSAGFNTTKMGSQNGVTIVRNNTIWGNSLDAGHFCCGGGLSTSTSGLTVYPQMMQAYNNLVVASTATCCASGTFPGNTYALREGNGEGTPTAVAWRKDIYDYNVGVNTAISNQNTFSNGSFSFSSTNILGTNPQFANAAVPGAPDCTGQPDVLTCLRNVDGAGFDVIARFTPTNNAVAGTGYKFFCAPTDILGTSQIALGKNCDPGAIKWSSP